jgi:hypothetical protein
MIFLRVVFQNRGGEFNKDSGNAIAFGDAGPKTRAGLSCNFRGILKKFQRTVKT